jgi:hypothetical protein
VNVDWKRLLFALAPIGLAAAGVPAPMIPGIVDGMAEAQAIIGARGAEKKAHVLKGANDAIDVINAMPTAWTLEPAPTLEKIGRGIDTSIGLVKQVLERHGAAGV